MDTNEDNFWIDTLYSIGEYMISISKQNNILNIEDDDISKIFYGYWFLYFISEILDQNI
jgi:hypothetical protein